MKTQTVVTEITHDDLVNLISTSSYGSPWLDFKTPTKSGNNVPKVEGECREDRMARVLLAGYPIFVLDCYAEDEDEFYGNLPHSWMGDCMQYELTLDDIKKGVARAVDSGTYIKEYVNHWAEEDGYDLDLTEAEALVQWIVFGEEIYG